ncbi:YqcC family protein [Thiolapillus sp.]
MSDDYQELSRHLQRMEKELRALGWWSEQPPDAHALASTAPFCHDRMDFHQWLQWVLIPGFQRLIEQESALPEECAIAPMAEMAWREEDPARIRNLVRILREFDQQVSSH